MVDQHLVLPIFRSFVPLEFNTASHSRPLVHFTCILRYYRTLYASLYSPRASIGVAANSSEPIVSGFAKNLYEIDRPKEVCRIQFLLSLNITCKIYVSSVHTVSLQEYEIRLVRYIHTFDSLLYRGNVEVDEPLP